jgi:hypothetical protein
MTKNFWRNARTVRAVGFFHGSQGVPSETGIGEITADFEIVSSALRERAAAAEKAAEARVLAQERAERLNQEDWNRLRAEAGEKIPNRLVPAAFIAVTVAAAVADVVLLAPMVDAMGIPDPTHQLFVAISFVAIGGMLIEGVRALLERAFNVQTKDVPAGKRRAAFRLAAAAAVLALAVTALFAIGLWRAEVLKHGGGENGWLADLLRAKSRLNSVPRRRIPAPRDCGFLDRLLHGRRGVRP